MKRIFLSFFASLLALSSIAAEVKGRVYNSTYNEGEPFATVRVYTAGNSKPYTTVVADVDGNFVFDAKKTGDYTIEISAVAKETLKKQITVRADENLDLGNLVIKDDVKTLNEVEVVAQKPLVQMSADEMTYNVDSDSDSRTYTLLEMLRKVPMVTVDGEDNITVNGSSNFQVYVDGKPSLLFSGNPSMIFKSMPASVVQKIEVVTNPGARYDAEGVGGVLNLVMNKTAAGNDAKDIKAYNVNIGLRGSNKGFGGNVYANGQIGRFSASLNMMYNQMMPGYSEISTVRTEKNLITSSFNKTKPRMPFTMGNLTLEYEIDDLTTIGASFSMNSFSQKIKGDTHTSINLDGSDIYSYLNENNNKNSRQGLNGSVNLSRNFDKEGNNKLNVTYQISHEKQNAFNSSLFTVEIPQDASMDDRTSDSRMKTTDQIAVADFTSKFGNNTISAGLKGTFRSASADNQYLLNGIYDEEGSLNYKNNSNIGAVYGEYAFRNAKVTAKAGIRYEHTWQSIDYKHGNLDGYKDNYGNIVPSASLGYNISMGSNIGLNYNMRISRPGISYLNPFVNQADPTQISYGNPNLEVEKTHNVSLVYNYFSQKFTFNVTLSEAYTGNGIEQYSFVDNDVLNTTYGNIVRKNNTSLNVFMNWMIGVKTRIFLNGGVSYLNLYSKKLEASNKGLQGSAMFGVQQQLPWDIRGNVFLIASTKNRTLQGWSTGFRMIAVNFSKSFLHDLIGVTIGANTGLYKDGKLAMDTYVETPSFTNKTKLRVPMASVNIGLTFKFGSKVKAKEIRGKQIENDFIDTKNQMEGISNESNGTMQ